MRDLPACPSTAAVDKWQNPEGAPKFTGYSVAIVPPISAAALWKLHARTRPRSEGPHPARFHSRPLFRARPKRHRASHRDHRRRHHVPDDGLHRLRQSADPRHHGHGQGRGIRRDLRRGGGEHLGDGALCQLSDRARARHGAQRVLPFTVVVTYKYSWQQGLAAVFCSGVLFLSVSIFRIRQYVIDSIPHNLKLAVSAGVGLFLGIIALETSGVIAAHPATLVTLGDLTKPAAVLALFGFVLIAALNHRGVIGGTLLGILAVTLIGLPLGLTHYSGVVSMPPSLAPTLLPLDFSRAAELPFVILVFSILFVDVFDNAGTLIGVTHRTGLMRDGKLARMKEALISDSFAAIFGSLIGTSTTTSYIDSAAGVAAGGRTGLTAVVVALCFLLALFFAPLAGMIPAYASAAALLYVACMMARGLAEIEWDDITESAPAVIAAITMPLTYSIATGIGLGFITYVLAKLIAGRFSQLSPAAIVLAALFALKFAVSG